MGHRHEPASSFFNLSVLAEYTPVASHASFMRATRGRLATLWSLAPPLGCPSAGAREERRLARAAGEDGVEAYGEVLRAEHERCEDGARRAPLDHYLRQDGAGGAVGLWRYRRGWLFGESVNWPSAQREAYWELRRHVTFRRELHEAARRFAATQLHGEPYLALHWRRGDRTHPEMGRTGQVVSEGNL